MQLTATEFELIRFMTRNPRRVLSEPQILDRVWNYDFGGQANVVELYLTCLRKKIDAGRAPDHPHDAKGGLRPQARRVTGFRPMRRAHDAIAERHRFGTSGYRWVLDADIEACFDSIEHVALMARVRERVKDKRVLVLVKAFVPQRRGSYRTRRVQGHPHR